MAFGKRAKVPPKPGQFGTRPEIPTEADRLSAAVRKLTEELEPASQTETAEPKPVAKPAGFQPSANYEQDYAVAVAGGMAVLETLLQDYADEHGVHLETITGALAALAGEFALRAGAEAAGQHLPTGKQFIVGGAPDPYLFGMFSDSPSLWALVCTGAEKAGADPTRFPRQQDVVARIAVAIAEGLPFPPQPSIPENHLPREWSPNACPRHRATVITVMARHGVFEPDEIAFGLGIALAHIFVLGRDTFYPTGLTPNRLATLALEIMTAVSRMIPLDSEIIPGETDRSRPNFKTPGLDILRGT